MDRCLNNNISLSFANCKCFHPLFRPSKLNLFSFGRRGALSDMQNLKGGKRGTRRSRGIENYSRLRKKGNLRHSYSIYYYNNTRRDIPGRLTGLSWTLGRGQWSIMIHIVESIMVPYVYRTHLHSIILIDTIYSYNRMKLPYHVTKVSK